MSLPKCNNSVKHAGKSSWRRFAGLRLSGAIPDETIILHRHLLEQRHSQSHC